jgi:S1-C subfamily serine protease
VQRTLTTISSVLTLVAVGAFQPRDLSAQTPEQVVERTSPAVVEILVSSFDGTSQADGFIVDPGGVIVTHLNAATGANTIFVKLPHDDIYERARVLAADEHRHIAILEIEMAALPTLEIGDVRAVGRGSRLTAIGSIAGVRTVATGEVVGRRMVDGRELIEIAGPTFPAASGGAVLDEKGRVVGVAVGALRQDQTFYYAIPIDKAVELLARTPHGARPEFAVVADRRKPSPPPARTHGPDSARSPAASPSDARRTRAPVDLSGVWQLRNTIQETNYAPYRGLQLGFRVTLFQDGDKIVGRGEKWVENGRRIARSGRSRILIEGTLEEATLNATFVEQGTGRTINGWFSWTVSRDGKHLRGRFADGNGGSSGASSGRRVH